MNLTQPKKMGLKKMRKIWAVAKITVAQAIRMKIALLFFILLIIILPVLSFIVTGDGTLKGKLQTFTAYGMGLMNFLLCILTIIIASYTLSSDLKQNMLHTILTKPIRRFELFIGKAMGLLILDLGLLIIFSGLIYGLILTIPYLTKPSDEEMQAAKNEFFTARAEIEPVPIDIERVKNLAMEDFAKENKLPKDPQERFVFEQRILAELNAQARSVPPGMSRLWQFEGLTPKDREGSIYIKYKFEAVSPPADEMVISYWSVGDLRPLKLGLPVDPYQTGRKDKNKTSYEIEMPASLIPVDGHLDVVFENYVENNTTLIFPEGEFKLLYRSDSFEFNFVRACLIIFARMIFLAVLGLSLSTWLSFPVVILISFVVFFIGVISGFILDSLTYVENLTLFFGLLKYLLYLLPRFDGQHSPIEFMVSGRMISWSFLGLIYLKLFCLQTVFAGLAGISIFSRREIAKISV